MAEWMSGGELQMIGGTRCELAGNGLVLLTSPSPRTGIYFVRAASSAGTAASAYGNPNAAGGANAGASFSLPCSVRFAFRPIVLPPSGYENIGNFCGYSININSTGTLWVGAGGAGGGANLGTGSLVCTVNNWYVVEMTVGVNVSGIVRFRYYADGQPAGSDAFPSFASAAGSGSYEIGTFGFAGTRFNAAAVTFDYDDMHVKEGANAYIGDGKIICLNMVDGPPYGTYTDYVPGSLIGGASSIYQAWNNFPFTFGGANPPTYAGNTSALLQRQTIFHAHSGLAAGTTIKPMEICQLSAVNAGSIAFYNLYRVAGVDWYGTSGALTASTWVLWYDFYGGTLPTVAQMDACEIGIRADAGRTGGLGYYTGGCVLQVEYLVPPMTAAGKIQARRKR